MDTISAAIAVATRSRYLKAVSCGKPIFLHKALINLKPTPQPHNSLYGYLQFFCFGLRMATAGGSFSSGKWWSQTIKSIPRSLAYCINSTDLIPQSSDMINVYLCSYA